MHRLAVQVAALQESNAAAQQHLADISEQRHESLSELRRLHASCLDMVRRNQDLAAQLASLEAQVLKQPGTSDLCNHTLARALLSQATCMEDCSLGNSVGRACQR